MTHRSVGRRCRLRWRVSQPRRTVRRWNGRCTSRGANFYLKTRAASPATPRSGAHYLSTSGKPARPASRRHASHHSAHGCNSSPAPVCCNSLSSARSRLISTRSINKLPQIFRPRPSKAAPTIRPLFWIVGARPWCCWSRPAISGTCCPKPQTSFRNHFVSIHRVPTRISISPAPARCWVRARKRSGRCVRVWTTSDRAITTNCCRRKPISIRCAGGPTFRSFLI